MVKSISRLLCAALFVLMPVMASAQIAYDTSVADAQQGTTTSRAFNVTVANNDSGAIICAGFTNDQGTATLTVGGASATQIFQTATDAAFYITGLSAGTNSVSMSWTNSVTLSQIGIGIYSGVDPVIDTGGTGGGIGAAYDVTSVSISMTSSIANVWMASCAVQLGNLSLSVNQGTSRAGDVTVRIVDTGPIVSPASTTHQVTQTTGSGSGNLIHSVLFKPLGSSGGSGQKSNMLTLGVSQ